MLSLMAAVIAFQATPVVRGVAYPDIMPVSRVRAGMRGYGLTVFRGAKIERFDVTVVAVVRNGSLVAPGHDMILIRMSGGPMTGRGANLIRGMSGSPIYIGGKCIGAFSQGEPTTKEPMGGVTPIEDMLEAWDPKLPQKMEARGGTRTVVLRDPIRTGRRVIRRIAFDAAVVGARRPSHTLFLRPCIGMMTLSGGSRRSLKLLRELMEPYGVEVMQAPTGRSPTPAKAGALVPGAAFSTMLLIGDIQTGATGTVTYRRGERLLGFGHPFLGVGPLAAPICPATIQDVYPLSAGSYKISTPGPAIGSTLQDRPFGISAMVGKRPPMIPITVDVDDRSTGRKRTYRMEAVPHPNLYSGLISLAVGSAIADLHPTPGPVMARVRTSVEAEDVGLIERDNTVFDARAIDVAASTDVEAILSVLANNPFAPVLAKRAHVRCVIEPGRRTATLERASVNASRYEPGDTIEVAITLKPYGGTAITKTALIAIPDKVPNGPMTLTVRGGGAPAPISVGGIVFRPSTPSPADQSPPANVRQMLDRLLEREKGDEIGVRLVLPTTSVAVDGRKLTDLPPTLDALMRSSRVAGTRLDRDEVKVVMPVEWVVTGQQTITINVQRKPASAVPTPQSPASIPGSRSLRPASGSMVSGRVFASSAEIAQKSKTGTSEQTKREEKPPQQAARPDAAAASAPQPAKAPASSEKPVAKVAKVWRHTASDWSRGTLRGVGMSSAGNAVPVPVARKVWSLPGVTIACVAADGSGGAYVGSAADAAVYRITATGQHERVAALPETAVTALYRADDGSLYVGTGPEGRTYRITPGSPPAVVHDAEEPYVLSLAGGSEGALLIGTGGGVGSVYRVKGPKTAEVLAAGLDRHVLALGAEANGVVWVGTAGKGLAARIAEPASPEAVFDVPGQYVTAIHVGRDGSVAALSAPKAVLYRFTQGTWSSVQLDVQAPSVGLQPFGDGLIAAGGASAWLCFADQVRLPIELPKGTEIVSVASDGSRAWLGTANNGELLMVDALPRERSGEMESAILDAGSVARWGKLRWAADGAMGRVSFQTRSGDTSEAAGGWSSWATLRESGDIVSPPARYLQYRVVLGTDGPLSPHGLREVSVSYLPVNRAPTVSFQVPIGGEQWAGKQTLKWQAADPDGDTLSFRVEYSLDGGATWQDAAPSSSQASQPSKEPATKEPTPSRTDAPRRPLSVAQVTEELDKHPNLPAAMREAILERTRKLNADFAASAVNDRKTPKPSAAASRETSRELDTAKLPDGTYRFRVTASDGPSNWDAPKQVSAISERVTICNAQPVVYVIRSEPLLKPDGVARFEVVAVQRHVPIIAAQWRLDGGDWSAARPVDLIADSGLETFAVETQALSEGKHTIEVQVFNGAGLSASEMIEVVVPERKAPRTGGR